MDYSFMTQEEYEEALIDEKIIEEAFYQADGQVGYKLKSRLVSPLKKNVVPVKQSAALARKVAILPKKVVVPSKALHKSAPSATRDQVQLKPTTHEVRFLDRLHYSFNLKSEIQKLKIPFPLIELFKNDAFKSSILNSLQPKEYIGTDFVNLQDDKHVVTLGPMIKDLKESCPPFYISLNIHDKILHNCLLDSGASHNLIPKAVMDEISLNITKPYQDLFSFDSRKVKCLGLIKDLAVNLTQLPSKSIMLEIMEQKTRWHPLDGSNIFHHSHVWRRD